MKLGILGTGMIVHDLMQTYHELHIEKTYILATAHSQEKAEKLVNDYQIDRIYYDYDELLNSDVDTIYCALPNHLHYSFCKKALMHHKHVIIEKPVTANTKELKVLMEIAHNNQLMIFEAVNLHYLPSFISLKEDVKQLGDIKIVSFNYSQYSSRYNAFLQGNILPAFDYHKAGGALMDLNVYNINALMGLFGKPYRSEYLANVEKNIDTSGIMLFDYQDFKAVTIGAKDCKAPLMNTIQGNKGAIVVNSPLSQMYEYTIYSNDGQMQTKTFEKKHRLYYEFKEFIRMIEEKDYQKQQDMLELSLMIAHVMEEGRKKEGVVFDND